MCNNNINKKYNVVINNNNNGTVINKAASNKFQYIVGFSVSLISMSSSVSMAWISPTLPKLFSDDTHIKITAAQGSWLSALLFIGAIIGTIPIAFVMDKFGRKFAMFLGALPLLIGWIIIYFATTIYELYAARILCGFTAGMSFFVPALYLGEIAGYDIRGKIILIVGLMGKSGVLYAYATGSYTSYHNAICLAIIPLILFFIVYRWLPESPHYLVSKLHEDIAYRNLVKLRGHTNVHQELSQIIDMVTKTQNDKTTFSELLTKTNRKAFIIIIIVAGAQQLCGIQSIIAYAHRIFSDMNTISAENNDDDDDDDDVDGDNAGILSWITPKEATILLAIIQILSTGSSSFFVDRCGRRPLLLISTGITGICNILVAIYYLLHRYMYSGAQWLPTMLIMIFNIGYGIGLAPIPLTLLGEIFPKNIKAKAGVVYTILLSILSILVVKLFQIVSDTFGNDYSFFTFGILTLILGVCIFLLVPETKQKSLDKILEEMKEKPRTTNKQTVNNENNNNRNSNNNNSNVVNALL